MYKKIAAHPTTQEIYAQKLIGENVVTAGEVEKMRADWRARLDAEQEASQGYKPNKADWLDGRWAGFKVADQSDDPRRGNTGIAVEKLREIGARSPRCRGISTRTARSSASSSPRQGDRDRRGHRLGDRRGAGVLLATARGPPGAPLAARTSSAAPSHSATRC